MDDWTNEVFYNPFGPDFLRLKINEDIRLKLLDSITFCLNNHEPIPFSNEHIDNAVINSIVDGKIGKITEEWLGKHPGNLIKNTIQDVLRRYGKRYFNTPCLAAVADVWYVVMKAGDFHILHGHYDDPKIAALSGAIYLEVPDNLLYPQGNIGWVIGNSEQSLYNNIYEHSPKSGDVFLWPSWLMHTVYPFRSEQERIMISFNGAVDPIKKKEDNG